MLFFSYIHIIYIVVPSGRAMISPYDVPINHSDEVGDDEVDDDIDNDCNDRDHTKTM